MNPTLSIIIPTYNAFEHLEFWESKNRPEKFKNMEFIFIDSNSNDGSSEYFEKLSRTYTNIYVYKIKSNIYEAMNLGVYYSHSDWLLFTGIDDNLLESISDLINYINKNDLSKFDLLVVDYQISYFKKIKYKKSIKQLNHPHHQSCIFNKKSLLNFEYIYNTKYHLFSDMDLIFRIIKCQNILYLPINCVNFSTGGKSTNGSYFKQIFIELTLVCFKHNKIFSKFYLISILRIIYYYIKKIFRLHE